MNTETISPPSHDHIRAAVKLLDKRRREAAAAGAVLAAKDEAYRASVAAEREAVVAARKLLDEADAGLRELVVAHYNATKKASPDGVGDKSPLPGIGVKVGTIFRYRTEEAFAWAKERGLCIAPESLDERAFLDLCKSENNRPAFVTVGEDPRPSIASDLSKALAAEGGVA